MSGSDRGGRAHSAGDLDRGDLDRGDHDRGDPDRRAHDRRSRNRRSQDRRTQDRRNQERDERTDAELLAATRSGDTAAYAEVFQRHRGPALGLARQLMGDPADADDAVSEAYERVLKALVRGSGPETAFRPYLLTTIRRLCIDRSRRRQREEVLDPSSAELRDSVTIDLTESSDGSLAAQAFSTLPERWQLVLWHMEVEGEKPAEVALRLDMAPNAVAALAYRAREGLRQAFLQAHLERAADGECSYTVARLGKTVRGALAPREQVQVDAHLDTCQRCQELREELTDTNASMRSFVAPGLLGTALVSAVLGHGSPGLGGAGSAGAVSGGDGGASGVLRGDVGSGAGSERAGAKLTGSVRVKALVAAALVVVALLGSAAVAASRRGPEEGAQLRTDPPRGGVVAPAGSSSTTTSTTASSTTTSSSPTAPPNAEDEGTGGTGGSVVAPPSAPTTSAVTSTIPTSATGGATTSSPSSAPSTSIVGVTVTTRFPVLSMSVSMPESHSSTPYEVGGRGAPVINWEVDATVPMEVLVRGPVGGVGSVISHEPSGSLAVCPVVPTSGRCDAPQGEYVYTVTVQDLTGEEWAVRTVRLTLTAAQ